ncbi:MAG: hypothetical protein JGK28_28505 [Microcoleus sp. PH2017_07_MST_O_A]|uniref:hypothetical protein n=1 Tax=unclassified Microcoleus TaxID=2642155 RepID=UPI001D7CDB4B|nr:MULTISPECIES: hypothetical protein [unclassified Microcoleus]MCC3421728.1 hypothetical protein [Microcoleus sp. PH2017_07_MST_O_A]MCC3510990.1 hypothetical protein [Microcoleus sp. PH2017_17_BER_D_A]TAG00869.1 MAG: hypothetical protein EAZ45_14490 [Oscillatoriales cyanobacterium]MCC3434795.1 hypothetical protein [Microcoleus sp. PH2017_05_CCC_O_A]MCC3457106.1 hypothetical protein [Microcoleus sp. PH2017_08_TRC_O_A]
MKNFSISVCFFHLNQTLGESLDRVSPQADLIWENLIKISEKLPFTELKDLKAKLVCYELDEQSQIFKHQTKALNLINEWLTEEQKQIDFATISHNGLAISGNLQPFLLNDTYAFDLSLFLENPDQDITLEELHLFEPSSLFLDYSENTLGETIWLYGETEVGDAECQGIANELVASLLKNTKFTARLVNEDKLLKVPLFEYEISQGNQLNKLYRILVWIDNQAISPDIPAVYDALFGSLWTRHKIEYVYQEGRESYIRAREAYSNIEAKIKEFKQNKPLEELQKLLESIPEISLQYQRQLRNLQADYTAIKVNKINHRNYLDKIAQPGDISSWLKFEEITCKRYLDQIETHISYIQPGKDLISEFISTLRGLVEIEQAKSDRQLQQTLQDKEINEKNRDRELENTIQAVGTGIGVGVGFAGILAAGYPLIEKPWDFPSPQHPVLPPHPFVIAVVVSCLCGGGLGWLAWFFTKRHLQSKSSPVEAISSSRESLPPS